MTNEKGKAFIQTTLTYIIFWIMMLILVLTFWPREANTNIEPETKFVYIYVTVVKDTSQEVEIAKIEEPVIEPKYGFTEDEIYLMTVLLSGSGITDGDGEYDIDFHNKDNHGQISLVLSVVMNRVMSDGFPNTVSEVIWAPGQFSPMPRWKNGLPQVSDKSYQIVKEWCEAYDMYDLSVMSIPESHLYFTGNGTINKSRERW